MMQISTKKSALVVPQTFANDFGKGGLNFAHGVVRSEGDPVYFAHMRKGKPLLNAALQASLLDAEPAKLAGKWLYLGGVYNHFGHFVAESIHRAWAWRQYGQDCCGVVMLPKLKRFQTRYRIPDYAKDLLGLFGLAERHLHFVTELTEVEELLVPEPGSQLFLPPSEEYIRFLASLDLPRHLAAQPLPEGFTPKVMVSRQHYRLYGAIAGLGALEQRLAQEGYFIFCPEQYPVATQLKVYLQAERLIFEEGSALHLLELLAEIKAEVLVIERRLNAKASPFDSVLAMRAPHYRKYSQAVALPPLSTAKFAGANTLSVLDLTALAEFLVQHGFASPALLQGFTWQPQAKNDVLDYLLVRSNPPAPGFDGCVLGYLQSVQEIFKNLAEK